MQLQETVIPIPDAQATTVENSLPHVAGLEKAFPV